MSKSVVTKRTNFFSAGSSFAKRVGKSCVFFVNKNTLKKRAELKITNLEAENARLQGMIDSGKFEPSVCEACGVSIADNLKAIEAVNVELKKALSAIEQFSYDEIDNDFYKAYKAAQSSVAVRCAVEDWFAARNIEVGADVLDALGFAVSGRKRAGFAKVVRSGGTTFSTTRGKRDVMDTLYATCADFMIAKGALKPIHIPADMKVFYEKKSK